MTLILRELAPADLPRLHIWRNTPELVTALGAPFQHTTPQMTDQWYQHYLNTRHDTVRLSIDFMPPLAQSPQTVGLISLLNLHPVNHSAELSLFIGDPACRGKGLGYAASKQMLTHAFTQRNLNRLYLQVLSTNAPALSLYHRLGFVPEGTLRQAVFYQGQYVDLLQMGLLRTEFTANTQ